MFLDVTCCHGNTSLQKGNGDFLSFLQYQTEADKKGFCFICSFPAYEFERHATVSDIRKTLYISI